VGGARDAGRSDRPDTPALPRPAPPRSAARRPEPRRGRSTMTDDTLHSGDPDELLLTELRRVAALLDPMPDRLVRAGRESLTWRSVDAELAALLSDSAVDDERAALVRSTAGLRAV